MGPLASFSAGGLIAGLVLAALRHDLASGEIGFGVPDLLLGGGGGVLLLMFLRRRRAARAQPTRAAMRVASSVETPSDRMTTWGDPSGDLGLDRGVQDIRRTDPGFDPARFAGYAGMLFRDAQRAWMTRDIASLRDRVMPEIFGELQAQCDRLRDAGQANRVEGIEITAEITEAWQERDRDYVTAYIGGSLVDYTVDEETDSLADGSRTLRRGIEQFWTFTRPAGLNFWMLLAIQTAR
jgi:predicted lipid-binding transport protein (Tim44 family)